MPFKDFAAGEVLTASDVDNFLMRQSVMTFDDATDRTTQLGTAVAEGMLSYLKDTDALQVYGTAWADVSSPGDITEVAAGYGLSGGGVSGAVTISASTTLTSSTAATYTVSSGDAGTYLRFTNAATITVSTATAFNTGEQVQIFNDGSALTILPGTDVTIYGRGTAQGTAGFSAVSQYDAFSLFCVGTNSYRVIGNLEAN